MTIKLFNTLQKEFVHFLPINSNQVKIYTCGPTVYNFIHIGNGRMSVFFDVVRRYLMFKGYDVVFVQNITDVDDRIIKTANELGVPEIEVSSKFIEEYNKDLSSLNVLTPSFQPKVTEHIPQIIDFISKLIKKGYAYEKNGDVYFRVGKFAEYGKLSNQSLSQLQHTEREIAHKIDYKENEFDFALWKAQKGSEVSWNSPWGQGRPGWHIECSAMSMNYLGETFDIHGGGLDLCFPHHDNEIAQSEALTGKPFANYWIHNNYVTVNGKKMSKSLGNFTTVRDVLDKYDGSVIRFFYLSVNYGSEIDYSDSSLEQAKSGLEKIRSSLYNLNQFPVGTSDFDIETYKKDTIIQITRYLDNNFDTSNAIKLLYDISKQVNILIQQNQISVVVKNGFLQLFSILSSILGIDFTFTEDNDLDSELEKLIFKREELKLKAKNTLDKSEKVFLFEEADAIRRQLNDLGIIIEDTVHGPHWKKINV